MAAVSEQVRCRAQSAADRGRKAGQRWPFPARLVFADQVPAAAVVQDAKFGIFIHWGVYSVPAAENEWYPRNMYYPKEGAYKNYRDHFANGDESKGYKDLIPLFKAEKFDANQWAELFKASGAQYVIPVAET